MWSLTFSSMTLSSGRSGRHERVCAWPWRGTGRDMAKNNDQDAQRSAIREAKREGVAPSAAGATTGASKQISTVRKGDDRHEHSSAHGKSKT
jgi:hypothetical protein